MRLTVRLALVVAVITLTSGCAQGTDSHFSDEAPAQVSVSGPQARNIVTALQSGEGGADMLASLTALDVSSGTVSATKDSASSIQADDLCEALYAAAKNVDVTLQIVEVSSGVAVESRRSDIDSDSACGLPHP